MTTLTLVHPAKKNNPTSGMSFDELVLHHRPMAHRLGWHLIRRWGLEMSKDEATSLIDYALCEALTRFDSTRGAELSTYLYYVLKGELKRVRRWNAKGSLNMPLADEHEGHGDEENSVPMQRAVCPKPSPEQELHHANVRSICKEVMDGLSQVQRTVVMETVAGESNVAGLARKLGYSRGHLSTLKNSALRTIRSQMRHRASDLLWDHRGASEERRAA